MTSPPTTRNLAGTSKLPGAGDPDRRGAVRRALGDRPAPPFRSLRQARRWWVTALLVGALLAGCGAQDGPDGEPDADALAALTSRVDHLESQVATSISTVVSRDDPSEGGLAREVTAVGRCSVPTDDDRLILTIEPTTEGSDRSEAVFPLVDLTECVGGRWTADFLMGSENSVGEQFWVRLYLGPEDELEPLIEQVGSTRPVDPGDSPSLGFVADELRLQRGR